MTEIESRMLHTLLQHLETWVRLFRGQDAVVMQRDINNLRNILGDYIERLKKLDDEPGCLYGND